MYQEYIVYFGVENNEPSIKALLSPDDLPLKC